VVADGEGEDTPALSITTRRNATTRRQGTSLRNEGFEMTDNPAVDATPGVGGFIRFEELNAAVEADLANKHGPHCVKDQQTCPNILECGYINGVNAGAQDVVVPWERERYAVDVDDAPEQVEAVKPTPAEDKPVGVCAHPGCTEPVSRGRAGPPSKFCAKHKTSRAKMQRSRRGRRRSVWEIEREERVAQARRHVAVLEAKAAGELPPPHTDLNACDYCGGKCRWPRELRMLEDCTHAPGPPWTLGQPNELTAEETELLDMARARVRCEPYHRPGCPAPEAQCCGPIVSTPTPPRTCDKRGEQYTGDPTKHWPVCKERERQAIEFNKLLESMQGTEKEVR